MPHQLSAWALSAGVAAGLIAVSLWRSTPTAPGQWAVVVGIWAAATLVLHLLLHNRWMRDLDERSRAGLARRRAARTAAAPPRRGAGHATRRAVVRRPSAAAGRGGRYDRRGRPPRSQHR